MNAPENRDIATMTAEELRQLFTWCDFKDSIGHLLTMNADFQALVARATAKRYEINVQEDPFPD